MSVDASNSAFTRHGSFRQATITERLADPQGLKPSVEKPPLPAPSEAGSAAAPAGAASASEENPFAVARPHATELMLQRQTSFRGFNQLQANNSPFKRQLSLRLGELPSTLERQHQSAVSSLATVGNSNNNNNNNKVEEAKEAAGGGGGDDEAVASGGGLDNAGLDSILMPRLAAAQGDTGEWQQIATNVLLKCT